MMSIRSDAWPDLTCEASIRKYNIIFVNIEFSVHNMTNTALSPICEEPYLYLLMFFRCDLLPEHLAYILPRAVVRVSRFDAQQMAQHDIDVLVLERRLYVSLAERGPGTVEDHVHVAVEIVESVRPDVGIRRVDGRIVGIPPRFGNDYDVGYAVGI